MPRGFPTSLMQPNVSRGCRAKTHLNLVAAQDELGLAGLAYYVQDIYRSSAAILHFMKPTRARANEYNSRLSLLAGVAHGLAIPLLMVAEDGYKTPLDYKDMLYRYTSIAKLAEHVETWLENLPSTPGTNKRLGRLKLDIELPVRTFGQYVAESESDALTDYFVHTNEFEAVLSGRTAVFTGRKGTGKTAVANRLSWSCGRTGASWLSQSSPARMTSRT